MPLGGGRARAQGSRNRLHLCGTGSGWIAPLLSSAATIRAIQSLFRTTAAVRDGPGIAEDTWMKSSPVAQAYAQVIRFQRGPDILIGRGSRSSMRITIKRT